MSTEPPSLAATLEKDGPLPWRQAARLAARIARQLDRLHARGGVHGGIEPLTVLFVGGTVRLADALPAARRDQTYAVPGRPAGALPDRQADFHALGRLIEVMLGGQPAPLPLAKVTARLLGERPEERYQSGNEVAAALELAIAAGDAYAVPPGAVEQPGEATPFPAQAAAPTAPERPAAAPRSRRGAGHGLLLVGLVALLVGGAVAALLLWPRQEAVIEAPPDRGDAATARLAPEAVAPTEPLPAEPVDQAAPPPSGPAEREQLLALLAGLRERPCTRVEVESGHAGVQFWGSVASAGDRVALLDAITTSGLADTVHVGLASSETICRLYDLLDAASEPAVPRLASLYPAGDQHRLSEADNLIVKVLAPDQPSHLWVDYFAADGMVVHLAAELFQGERLPPHEVVKIGDPRDGHWLTIAPPFGDEVVVAIASAEPLFAESRPMVETAEDYLDDLATALESLSQPPLASTIAIRTRHKGARHAAP